MSVTLVQDGVFGDTGKGKVSHALSSDEDCDVGVRAVGGGNAGHVIVDEEKIVALHVLPARSIYGEALLGLGMATHIPTIFSDAAAIQKQFGNDPLLTLKIAAENHILFEGHKEADRALERRKGKDAVGTTGSGIGPAYADKALRVGMRFEELLKPIAFAHDRYRGLLKHWEQTYGVKLDSTQEDMDIAALRKAHEMFEGSIVRTQEYWTEKFAKNVRVLIEGAQGSELSIDSDGYPYVTSSATTTLGHLQGAGIPHSELTKVILTAKAYTTRVGNGPFPTQMDRDLEKEIQKKGGEKGSTTGRDRKTGWLNAVRLAMFAQAESADLLAILKGDVLDGVPKVQLAVDENKDGLVMESFNGWNNTNGVRSFNRLDPNYMEFLWRIQQITRTKIGYIGTGRDLRDLIKVAV